MRQHWIPGIALIFLTSTAYCQTPPSIATKPDVQILIAPGVDGWTIATVYPGKVARSETQARLRRLRLLTRWPVEGLAFEDRQLDRETASVANPTQSGAARPVMSSATFQTSGNLVDFSQGTLAVEPFLVAFRDFSRIHITYLGLRNFKFQGLSRFRDSRVELSLIPLEDTFTYQATLTDHQFELLNLPLRDSPQQESANTTVNSTSPNRRLLLGIGAVGVIALGVAGIAYRIAQRISHRQ